MNAARAHRIGGGLAAGLVAVGVVGVVQAAFGPSADLESRTLAVSYLPLLAASALMLWHRPKLPITWALGVMTAAWTLVLLGSLLDPLREGGGVGSTALDLALRTTWPLLFPMIPVILTLYPTMPTSRFGRGLLATELTAIAVTMLTFVTRADDGDPAWLFHIDQVALVLLLGCAVVAVVRLVIMWRRARGRERAQLSLVLASGLAVVTLYVVGGLFTLAFGSGDGESQIESAVVTFLLVGAIPAAIAVALLRHHLYGVDLVVNRILVWTVLVASITGLAVLTTDLAAALLGRTQPDPVLVVIPCLLVAVAAVPLRRVLQRGADVLIPAVDPERKAFRRLAGRLDAAVPPDRVPYLIAEGLGEALGASSVRVSEDAPDGSQLLAEWGAKSDGAPSTTTPLRHAGETVGSITVWPELDARQQALLEGLSSHAAVALQASRLTRDLERSRARLVTSREEERNRLRQDLHDELSPSLAGIRLALAAARTESTASSFEPLLARAQQEAGDAVEVIRRILDDLRPVALDEQGLVGGIRLRAESLRRPGEFDIDVSVRGLPGHLASELEVAAYRITSEALMNAAKHSGAQHAHVGIELRDGHLEMCVWDDGTGVPEDYVHGVGLQSMCDRAETLGGSLHIEPMHPHGTRVSARLPVPVVNETSP